MVHLSRHVSIVGLLAVSTLLGLLGYLTTSLWFVWYLLPGDVDLRVALSPRKEPLQLVVPKGKEGLPPDVLSLIGVTHRLGFSVTSGKATSLVLIPTITNYRAVHTNLVAAGWSVKRVGFVMRASPPGHLPSSPLDALGQTLRRIITPRAPVAPLAIVVAEPSVVPGVTESLAGIVLDEKDRIIIALSHDLSQLYTKPKAVLPPYSQSNELTLILPADATAWWPAPLLKVWNERLQSGLKLERTKPVVISNNQSFDMVALVSHNNEVAIGVKGNVTAFMALANGWIQEEERQTRLVRRAFALPDRTIGYEQVPGEPAEVFGEESSGCRPPRSARTSAWLCHGEEVAVLGSSESAARGLLGRFDRDWSVSLSPRDAVACRNSTGELKNIWCNVSSIRAAGFGTGGALIELTINPMTKGL